MAHSFVCLLALVAVAAAYAPPQPTSCYSDHLGKQIPNGEKWFEPGCQRAECINGEVKQVQCDAVATDDPSRPTARCRQVDGVADADYPACCPTAVCDRCYSEQLNRVFDNGAVYTEPGCTRVTCDNGNVRKLPCPSLSLEPGCRLEDGDASAEHPACCPTAVCPRPDQCYLNDLDKVLNDGDVLTKAGCTQVTCQNGEATTLPCPLVVPGPGCELQDGQPGAQYPGCCPQMYCPTPTSGGY